MAIACSTSAFKVPLDEALGEISRLGFDSVDLIAIPSWGHVIPAELACDWDAKAEWVEGLLSRHGLAPVAMNLSVANPHQRDDESVNAQRLSEVKAVARLMSRLGVKTASFFPGGKWSENPWEQVLAETVVTVREMLEAGGATGVTFAVELHYNTPFETLDQGKRLLEALPELKVAYDPSHYALQGIDLRQTQLFIDRAAHVHLRDAAPEKMCVPFGAGTIDFDWIIDALAASGYKGHYSIEYLPKSSGDSGESIRKLRDKLAERLG